MTRVIYVALLFDIVKILMMISHSQATVAHLQKYAKNLQEHCQVAHLLLEEWQEKTD